MVLFSYEVLHRYRNYVFQGEIKFQNFDAMQTEDSVVKTQSKLNDVNKNSTPKTNHLSETLVVLLFLP